MCVVGILFISISERNAVLCYVLLCCVVLTLRFSFVFSPLSSWSAWLLNFIDWKICTNNNDKKKMVIVNEHLKSHYV